MRVKDIECKIIETEKLNQSILSISEFDKVQSCMKMLELHITAKLLVICRLKKKLKVRKDEWDSE